MDSCTAFRATFHSDRTAWGIPIQLDVDAPTTTPIPTTLPQPGAALLVDTGRTHWCACYRALAGSTPCLHSLCHSHCLTCYLFLHQASMRARAFDTAYLLQHAGAAPRCGTVCWCCARRSGHHLPSLHAAVLPHRWLVCGCAIIRHAHVRVLRLHATHSMRVPFPTLPTRHPHCTWSAVPSVKHSLPHTPDWVHHSKGRHHAWEEVAISRHTAVQLCLLSNRFLVNLRPYNLHLWLLSDIRLGRAGCRTALY